MTFDGVTFAGVAAVLGWIGTFMLLLAYWLVSNDRVSGHSVPYQALNIGGSVGLGLAAVAGRVWSAATLNAIWALIGVAVLVKVGLAWTTRAQEKD
jgi:hypothetical protein